MAGIEDEVQATVMDGIISAGRAGPVLGRAVFELVRAFKDTKHTAEVRAALAKATDLTEGRALMDLIWSIVLRTAAQSSNQLRHELEDKRLFAELLMRNGGTFSASQVGVRLGGIGESAVRKRKDLLALELGREFRYPVWQFHGERGLVPNFREVMTILAPLSVTAKVRFFLSKQADLDGETPLEALRHGSSVEVVRRLANAAVTNGGPSKRI